MGNTILERVSSIKYLGVMLDENFNWAVHISHLQKKLAGSVSILSKLKYYVDTKLLIHIYPALIASRLHYGITCWGAATQTALKPIKVLQNRAIRFILKVSRYTKLDVSYLNLRLLKFDDIYHLKIAQFMFNYQQGTLPPFLKTFLLGSMTFTTI